MSMQSPMMRRMKTSGFGVSLPKKGRIRIVLAILALVVGVNIFGALTKGEKISKDNKFKIFTGNDKKKNPKEDKVQKTSYLFSFNDVSEIVKKQHPNFDSSEYEFQKDGKSYKVHYSVDSSLQKLGEHLMNSYRPKFGAVVAIQPNTGRVLSLITYQNDTCTKIDGDLYCTSTFPAASVFKTITASTAIEKANYNSQSIVRHVGKKSTLYKYQLEKDLRSYTEFPLEEAFANSVNPVFARIGMYVVGEDAIDQFATKYGFNATVPFEIPNEPSHMIHTDSSMSLAELASGFNRHTTLSPLLGALIASSICENGNMPKPFVVDSITDTKDSAVYRAERDVLRKPILESTAHELRIMMHAVARYGTGRKSFKYINQSRQFDTLEYGGKTGSIDKEGGGRVDWFIGFARNPSDPKERIAIGAVTVHGAYWTVHSSYIAAEYIRVFMHSFQKPSQERERIRTVAKSDISTSQLEQKTGTHM